MMIRAVAAVRLAEPVRASPDDNGYRLNMTCDDSNILSRLRRGDPDAMQAVVQRHGRMVYNVCHRVLGRTDLAEDAAQAVFVLLLKKQRLLGEKTLLGPWLYRAAEFVARNALRAHRRRITHERAAATMSKPDTTPATEEAWADIRPALDRAMAELPERLRAPIVLVHLEGRPGAEAARLLGLPQRTFYDRLAKGLDRLRRRLSGQALALSPAALGAVLSGHGAEMAAPAALTGAGVGAAGGTTGVQLILEGVMSTVFCSKTQVVAVVALAIVLSVGVTAPVAVHLARTPTPDKAASGGAMDLALLQGYLSALDEENQALRKALMAGDADTTRQPIAAPATDRPPEAEADVAQLLDEMPWDVIGAAVAKDAREHPDNAGTSAELVAALLPHLPKLLALQKALGAATIEELFDHDLVQAYVIPIYARELAGVQLTAAQARDVAAIMRSVQSVREHLDEAELPVYDFLVAAADAKGRLRDVLGEEAMEKLTMAQLVTVTPPPRLKTQVFLDGSNTPVPERARNIAARWISAYQLDPSMETTLAPISAELAEAVDRHPTVRTSSWSVTDDPVQTAAPALLEAYRQATSRILREVPLTEEQRQKVRHSLIFEVKTRTTPETGP